MKKLLTLFALLTCLISSAQVYQKYPQYGGEWNRLWIKTNLSIPNDTLTPPTTSADDLKNYPAISLKGTQLYVWDTTLNKWSAYSNIISTDWSLLGNTGTNPATNGIGTLDAQPLKLITNNTERARILAGGNVGIGTNNPQATLHVDGTLRFVTGAQGSGKVLVSDGDGGADWAMPAAPALTATYNGYGGAGNTLTGDSNWTRLTNGVHIESETVGQPRDFVTTNYTDAINAGCFYGRHASGTKSSPTGILAGQAIVSIAGAAMLSNGTWPASDHQAVLSAFAEEDQTPTSQGSYWRFETTPNGATSPTPKVWIMGNGDVGIGSNPSVKLDVSGNIWQRTVAGTSVDAYTNVNALLNVSTTNLNAGISLYNSPGTGNKWGIDFGYNGSSSIYTVRTFFNSGGGASWAALGADPTGQSSFVEKMVLTGAGNLGIGTDAPGEKLTVVGGSISGRWKARVGSTASSATPTINTDNTDVYKITALAENITSFTTNLTGTPNDGDVLEIQITDNGTSRTLAFGSSFVSSSVTIPATTAISTTLTIIFQYYTISSYGNNKWVCASFY